MDYTSPVLDLSTRGAPLTPMMFVGPKFTPLDSEPSSSNMSICSNTQIVAELSDSNDSMPTTSTGAQQTAGVKLPRPFKAYPKDPLSVAVSVASAEAFLRQDSCEVYTEFRKRMLSQVHTLSPTTNKNMRRYSQTSCSASDDPNYWEKRRKNNEAAKRSRDARRAKEDEIAIRCSFLEQENMKLRYELATLKDELGRLRTLIYK